MNACLIVYIHILIISLKDEYDMIYGIDMVVQLVKD